MLTMIATPIGAVPFVGSTMSPEREKGIARASALRDMPRFGLEPCEENLTRYYALVREVLA